jgi:hypothetical protein
MSKPHIDLLSRGTGPESIDYQNHPVKERLSTCPCDDCLDLYKKIHGKDSPLEYRTQESADIEPKPTPTAVVYNSWKCPAYQMPPSSELEELIKRAPWAPGKVYHSQDGMTPDIDTDGSWHAAGSIAHHFKQFTELK